MMIQQWALLKKRRVVNIITTEHSRDQLLAEFPGFDVKGLITLPKDTLSAYEYWEKRP